MAKSTAIKTYFFKKAVKIPMYGGNFIIIFSNDIKRVCETCQCNTDKVPHLYAHTFHNFKYDEWESFAVCFNFWDVSRISLGTIAHEVTHVCHKLMAVREFSPDFDNDEAEAYLVSWAADEIEKFMKKCNIV
jgi:hypothetical protein